MSALAVKVCGMREAANIRELTTLSPDYVGFIFYPQSKRFVGDHFDEAILLDIPSQTKKVGVFVNSSNEIIIEKLNKFRLDFVQLHGDEGTEQCKELFEKGVKIIKAFPMHDGFDFNILKDYEPYVAYFLFDTQGKDYGGNGVVFNWKILENYWGSLPFFLSGGISLDEVEKIKVLNSKMIHAVDLNSRFESAPGVKDIGKLKSFKEALM